MLVQSLTRHSWIGYLLVPNPSRIFCLTFMLCIEGKLESWILAKCKKGKSQVQRNIKTIGTQPESGVYRVDCLLDLLL